jgi:hypothetical protein
MPEFDVVTGVSTGALIAPFAFLGDARSIDTIVELYRNPGRDLVKQRWPLYFLPANESFATVPGLERELRARVDLAMLQRIADASRQGRFLIVNTTDVDDGGSRVWDVGSEAQRAVDSGDVDRVHRILLASSGIPGTFPFREIDGALYVDGGVTGNILYGGAGREERSLPAVWAATYPELPVPTLRFWVIFNNQLRPLPQVTAPTWTAIVARSLEMGTRGDGHRHPASVSPGGHRGAQARRGGRSARGRGAERFCPAQSRRVHQRDHEGVGGPGRTPGCRPGAVADGGALGLAPTRRQARWGEPHAGRSDAAVPTVCTPHAYARLRRLCPETR